MLWCAPIPQRHPGRGKLTSAARYLLTYSVCRPGDLLLSPIRNAKSDPWSGPEPLRIEYAVHPLPEANGAASSNANDSAVDAVVVAALSDEDSSVSEASSNGHAHGDDDEISSNTDTRSHTNDNTGLERNTNGGIAYQGRSQGCALPLSQQRAYMSTTSSTSAAESREVQ